MVALHIGVSPNQVHQTPESDFVQKHTVKQKRGISTPEFCTDKTIKRMCMRWLQRCE